MNAALEGLPARRFGHMAPDGPARRGDEIFGRVDLDRCGNIIIDRFERGEISTAFVDIHRLWHTILGDRFFKLTPGCSFVRMGAQQEIDGVAVLVDGAIEILI